MVNLFNGVLCYLVYPIFLGFLGCYFLNFAIMLCTSSIVKLVSELGIEKQCNEIFILKPEQDKKH